MHGLLPVLRCPVLPRDPGTLGLGARQRDHHPVLDDLPLRVADLDIRPEPVADRPVLHPAEAAVVVRLDADRRQGFVQQIGHNGVARLVHRSSPLRRVGRGCVPFRSYCQDLWIKIF